MKTKQFMAHKSVKRPVYHSPDANSTTDGSNKRTGNKNYYNINKTKQSRKPQKRKEEFLSTHEAKKKKPELMKKQYKKKNTKGNTISTTKKISKDVIRIIPLGGVEEVGKNMTVVEYGNDILVFDCGIQFVDEDTPGIDYLIPNTKYLEENKHKIKALIITHGHLDHIAAIPYIMDKIGNPTIYTGNITSLLIKKRATEFPDLPKLKIKVVNPKDKFKLGDLGVKFFEVTHSIPDSMGISVETPFGNIVITGDYKLEHTNGIPVEREEKVWSEIGKDNNLLLISDSTNAEKEGFSISEGYIRSNIEKIIRDIGGRIIIGTFASQFNRMIAIIGMAEKYNKKVVLEGRSIKTNLEIALISGLLKPKKETIIQAKDLNKYPPNKIVILATGAQGEEFAALMRMSTKKHKMIKLTKDDTIVLSSSIVPGNETNVQKLKDSLYRNNLKIIHYQVSDVHSGGHGRQGELLWVAKTVNAKYFMPAYGWHSMLKVHAEAVKTIGIKEKDIVIPDNGSIIEIQDRGNVITILKEKAPSNIVMVDGFSIGDIQDVVIRDRQALAEDGIFIIVATINARTGKLRKSPDIISRGFVYLRESQELLQQTRLIIKKVVESSTTNMYPINFDPIKTKVTDEVRKFLLQQTAKKPLVIPVILAV